jgi:4-alpha-glucanotransferase
MARDHGMGSMKPLAEADRLGIDVEYLDARGRRRRVSPQVIEKVVEALRSAAAQPAALQARAAPSPRQAYQGPAGRWWMLATQLYGVRSQRNWGHGDFSDLLALIELAAELGAGGVGVNPLHVLFEDRPGEPSPYSPNSRLFLNPLYIDVEAIPDFAHGRTSAITTAVERLRQAELVDYVGVADLKQRGLRLAYEAFASHATPERREDFEKFRRSRHPALARFASFELLRRRLKGPWWEWPTEWQTPDEAALERLRAEAGEDIGFYEYAQWIADRQLMRCRDRARELALPVGLYLDVAVGVRTDGFDAWNAPDAVVRTLAVGAPPDALNTAGQNWGLAGFSGVGLQAHAFEPFREMLRASMRYAGAIRLDHVLGLKRLYLIPDGMPPDQGAYVRMPFEQLLSITAEESAKCRCIVIGEDLGTVPKDFRERVAQWGIWTYQVMMFERGNRGAFHPPEHYAERALVTFSTHDLPTFAGWISGHDLQVREALHMDPGETGDERARAIKALRRALRSRGLKSLDVPSIVRYLAASPAKLLVVGLEDALDVREQVNVPGTIDAHPNWRRKLPLDLESMRQNNKLWEIARVAADSGRAADAEHALRSRRQAE